VVATVSRTLARIVFDASHETQRDSAAQAASHVSKLLENRLRRGSATPRFQHAFSSLQRSRPGPACPDRIYSTCCRELGRSISGPNARRCANTKTVDRLSVKRIHSTEIREVLTYLLYSCKIFIFIYYKYMQRLRIVTCKITPSITCLSCMYNHRRPNDLHLHHVASCLNIAARPSRIDSIIANMTRQLYHVKVNVVLVVPLSA
jgi:hypothetical protein